MLTATSAFNANCGSAVSIMKVNIPAKIKQLSSAVSGQQQMVRPTLNLQINPSLKSLLPGSSLNNLSSKTPKVKLQRIKVQPKSVNPLGEKTKKSDLLVVIDSSVKNCKKFKTDSLSP